MTRVKHVFYCAATAFSILGMPVGADCAPADAGLYETLAQTEGDGWIDAEMAVLSAWEDTGSEALNMIQNRGEGALDRGDYPSAIGHLTALTDHAPDHAMGFQLRGMAYWMNGDFGPAGADLAHALMLEPKQYLALTQLGTMLEELGDLKGAAAALDASLAINPHQMDAQDAASRIEAQAKGTDI